IPTDKLAETYRPLLHEGAPQIVEQVIAGLPEEYRATLAARKQEICNKVAQESQLRLEQILGHLKEDVQKVFSFKNMVLRNLTGPRTELLVNLFQEIGSKEFRFIAASGLYFGALFGAVQMLIWYFYPEPWTLPVQGVIVGYVTNWLALLMIFRPMEERRFLFFRYQGLFHRRQEEVSDKFSTVFAEHVMNGRNILDEVLYRRIARSVVETATADIANELRRRNAPQALLLSLQSATENRKEIAAQLAQRLASASETIEKLINRAMNVKSTIYNRMKELPGPDFETLLRSAFQQDEWILIVTGAVLGALVGLGQMFYMLAVKAD
ncbi:MAG: DUF445 family protein, partial [Leptospiraceae bacterium]|nr:DUF445 family protein [Leptospiraceae bacterium]